MSNSVIDDNRIHSLLAVNTVGSLPLPISGLLLTNSNALVTALVDGSGNQITSFGGGQQYIDAAAAQAHPTGTGIIFNNAGTYNFVSNTQPLPVTLNAGSSVIGHVIVDSGTITTVSALTAITNALPAGSNVIGHVLVDSGTITTVSALTAITNALPAGTNVIGHVIVDSGTVTNLSQIATVTPTFGDVANAASIAGALNVGVVGKYQLTPPTLTDTQFNILNLGSKGALRVEIFGASSTNTLTIATAADTANLTGAAKVYAQNGVYNGSTFDLWRSIVNATNSVGTGIAAVGNLAQFDDVAPTAITENQFGNLRMSTNRNLYNTIRDAAGNERGANVNAANQLSISVDAIAATTTLTGNGITGAGSQRVTVASDNSAIALWGHGATGSTVPANAIYCGVLNHLGLLQGLNTQLNAGDGANSPVAMMPYTFNGTNSDRQRGNEDVILLASAAHTTTQTSADLVNYNGLNALVIVVDVTVIGTGSITMTINGKDPASGKYYLILSGAAIVSNSTNRYRVGPNIAAVANSIAQDYLPRTFQIVITANNVNSVTYSVGYTLIHSG